MKVAVTIGTDDAHPQALVVFRGLERSLPRIRELGYDGIELALFDPASVDPQRLRRLLADNGLELPVISTGQISRVRGVHFTDPEPEKRARALEIFGSIVDLAGGFGADVNVSLVRGRVPAGTPRADAEGWLSDCLERACRRAQGAGVSLVLEQMNRYETDLLNSVDEIAAFIERLGSPNLLIHADTFHMNIEDRDIAPTLARHVGRLGYVHLADSNRLSPGLGHLDFDGVLAALARSKYRRWLGVEVLTIPDPVSAAARAIAHIRECEGRVGQR